MHRFCGLDADGSAAYAGCPAAYAPAAVAGALLGMYGLAGNVSLAAGRNARRVVLAAFPFCSLVPDDAARAAAAVDPALCSAAVQGGAAAPPPAEAGARCLNATALAARFRCRSTYPFAVWAYGPERNVTVRPSGGPSRRRALTPFNHVVGGLVLTQRRRRAAPCTAGAAGLAAGPIASQFVCQRPGFGEAPFGTDAAFQHSSTLYDGKLAAGDYFAGSEMRLEDRSGGGEAGSKAYPYAFFPHQWGTGGPKDPSLVVADSGGLYKLYFDTQLSAGRARQMVRYLQDAGFVDGLTEQIELEVVTYNAQFNSFGILTVQFRWDMGGAILWEYQYNSAQLSLYSGERGQLLLAVEVAFAVMLLLDVVRESRDIRHAHLRENVMHGYFLRVSNWIDWGHYALIAGSVVFWVSYNVFLAGIDLKAEYPILRDLNSPCRYFSTDPQYEFEFLRFTNGMKGLAYMKNMYSAMNCLIILLFVVRILKILDFQPRMSLITRTLRLASTDLFHYVCLFSFIFIGYASMGTFLLGDRLPQFQNLGNSCSALFRIVMGWDPLYRAMLRAASKSKTQSTAVVFLIFYWSWIIVATFVMMNIVLAIIVEAYTNVKGRMKEAPTITREFATVCHESLLMLLGRVLGTQSISDSDLEKALIKHMREFQAHKKLLDAIPQKYSRIKCLRLPGGLLVSDQDIIDILSSEEDTAPSIWSRLANAAKRKASSRPVTRLEEDGVEIVGDDWSAPPAIQNLIKRYSAMVDNGEEDDELLEFLRAQNVQRKIAMCTSLDFLRVQVDALIDVANALTRSILPAEELEKLHTDTLIKRSAEGTIAMDVRALLLSSTRILGELRVTVVSAKRLPKLDIFGESDPFCVLVLNELSTPDTGECRQEVLARTDAKKCDSNPLWNSEHLISLTCGGDTQLVAAVLDKDELGDDEFVGSATIRLSDLPLGVEIDKWYYLRNDDPSHLLKRAMIRLKIQFSPTVQSDTIPALSVTRHGSCSSLERLRSDESGEERVVRMRNASYSSFPCLSSAGSWDDRPPDANLENSFALRSSAMACDENTRTLPRAGSSFNEECNEHLNDEFGWLHRRLSSVVLLGESQNVGPKTLEVTLVSARHLPKMDMFNKADPYVKLEFNGVEYESEVCRNTLPPNVAADVGFSNETGFYPASLG